MKDLKSGLTLILLESNEPLDPTGIFQAIRGAGFGVPKVKIVVRGAVEVSEDGLRLRVPGLAAPLVLEGGEKVADLKARGDRLGAATTISGMLSPGAEGGPAKLSVKDFQ